MVSPVTLGVNNQIAAHVRYRTTRPTLTGNEVAMASEKLDRRIRRTRQAIHLALMTLMQEKGYDAVTVTDIIERADIGRSTFYSHYTDKRDVLFASLDELADFLRAHRDDGDGLFGFSLAMFEHAHEQLPMVRALLGRRGGAVVRARVEHLIGELVREQLTPLAARTTTPSIPVELTVAGVVGAYMALLARWLDEDEPHTPAHMDAAFRRLILPGVTAALQPSEPDDSVPGAPPRRQK
jgi:AcrR family transcriptional regulator